MFATLQGCGAEAVPLGRQAGTREWSTASAGITGASHGPSQTLCPYVSAIAEAGGVKAERSAARQSTTWARLKPRVLLLVSTGAVRLEPGAPGRASCPSFKRTIYYLFHPRPELQALRRKKKK